ncbi:MAG TPA: HEAT repeat domain-containing protein, partial [Vicinamibacterales bacterium]|nr:HEAT repeat domain-containing protein [Vicinamibacterales bacterium]
MRRTLAVLACAALCAASCATAPPAPAVTHPAVAGPSFDQKLSSILRLEDQRMLRDPAPPLPPAPPPVARGQKPAAVEAPPPAPPDLTRLLADGDARIRRRAALAVGRVGMKDGAPPLVAALGDSDPEVRQMAAFALGLLGDKSARDALIAALGDQAIAVRASAAEALGLIGDASAADAIAKMAAPLVGGGAFAQPPTEADEQRRDTPAGAVREAAYALVRLKAYPALASVVLDPAGQPVTPWWPIAYALSRIEDARAANALMTLLKDEHPYTRAFALKGLGALKYRAAVPAVLALVSSPESAIAVEAVRALGKIGDPAASARLLTLARDPKTGATLRIETVS